MPLTIRFSDQSQSTPSDHSDDDYVGGAPVETLSSSSQLDWSDQSAGEHEDEYVHVRHVRVRRTSFERPDDIDPSDSASRPATSRTSSGARRARGPADRGASRRRTAVPEPPPHPRPARGPSQRIPREPTPGRAPRPESFHSGSLDQDDYPYGGPGQPYRPGAAPGWDHVPQYSYPPEPSVISDHYPPRDVMAYRNNTYHDPIYDDNPFASRAPPMHDYDGYTQRPAPRARPPPPQHRYSVGPMGGPPPQALMRYHTQPYYDHYAPPQYYHQHMPPPEAFRQASPEKEPPKVATPPAPGPSPSEERFAQLELMIRAQTEFAQKKAQLKMAQKMDEERKKKEADEKTQTEKLIALETLLKKQNEAAIARELAMEAKAKQAEASAIAKMQKEAAEKAATEKISKELSEAAAKAKKAAEEEAAAKAKAAKDAADKAAQEAKDAAEKAAKEAKDAADKAFEEQKKKLEETEAAKKKFEEEAAALKPKGVAPPVKFKDAVGRKFSFPFDVCKSWKGMEALIKQAFMHVDVLGPHVMEGHYDLIGPDGEIILPQIWDTMIKPDYSIEMQMWPLPELEKDKKKAAGPPAGGVPHGADLQHLLAGLSGGAAGKAGKGKGKVQKGKPGVPIVLPPPGILGMIPPPPPGIPAMPGGADIDVLLRDSGALVGESRKKKKKGGGEVGGLARWMLGPGPKKKK